MSGLRHPNGDEVRTHDYLAKYGEVLLAHGYHIVPIRVGGKSPGFDGWEKSQATKRQLREWLQDGHAQAGVGVLTRNTPAIDLDIRDEEMALKMETYIRRTLGANMLRIGKAPKRLFLFRTDKPFRKMRSSLFWDEWKEDQQVEILGEGQQACGAQHRGGDGDQIATSLSRRHQGIGKV